MGLAVAVVLCLLGPALGGLVRAQSDDSMTAARRSPTQAGIVSYIAGSWDTLSRSMSECKSVVDLKVQTAPVLYLPAGMAVPPEVAAMQRECHVDVRHLPRPVHRLGDVRGEQLPQEGLLYLPNRYVVPGGRFNEMYGWDSYFIVLGLVHDNRIDLAKGMVDNFLFEIENYGAILNANRTYFFTRSQPPFLSSMMRAVYEHGGADKIWLGRAYRLAARDYGLWISADHRAGTTGLARYFDLGAGPVPEMADDSSYYPDVIRWLLAHPTIHPEYLVSGLGGPGPNEPVSLAKISCDPLTSHVCATAVVDGHRLAADFFRGDRAMRESGFDTSFRFGSFSGSTADYAPVCLNSLLFKYESDMGEFAKLLGKSHEATVWKRRATARRSAIDQYLWDAAAGMYFDYNYVKGERSSYRFVSTFYPLWAGVANPAQANAVRQHLSVFEHTGGIAMSDFESGVQWDLPFGWAPTTWLTVSGLDRYSFHEDAVRISQEFSNTVLDNFEHDGTIREKYNVVDGSANVKVAAGYKSNVIGFGWTNGVYLKLQEIISAKAQTANVK